jgi:hypothetical protein
MPAGGQTTESFVREQFDAIVDLYWDLLYRDKQRAWTPEECPWHKRLEASGRDGASCPMCAQVNRAQDSQDDEGETLKLRRPVYSPEHKKAALVRVIVDYITRPTFREKGTQHGQGPQRSQWQCRITMANPVPTSSTNGALDPFAVELATQFRQKVREAPFLTMNSAG